MVPYDMHEGISAGNGAEGFFGRVEELSVLRRICLGAGRGAGAAVMVYGPPNAGKTRLLLKLREILAHTEPRPDEPRPFPFYFSFSGILLHPLHLAETFLREYVCQLLAFHGEEPPSAADLDETAERLAARGLPHAADSLAAHRRFAVTGDALSALVNALSLPFRFRTPSFHTVFLLDDFQFAERIQGVPGGTVLSILRPHVKSGRYAVILSGSSPGRVTGSLKREGLFGAFQLLDLKGLTPEAATAMWNSLCSLHGVKAPAALAPRAVARMGSVPSYLRLFVEEVAYRGGDLPDEVSFENLYARSVTEGNLNRYWKEFFENAMPDRVARGRAVRFLKRVLVDRFPLDTVEGALSVIGAPAEEGSAIVDALEFKGLAKTDFERIEFVSDPVLEDFLYWAHERGLLGKGSSQVAAAIVQARLARYAEEREAGERARWISEVRELLRRWDNREVPSILLDFPDFLRRYGGKGVLEVMVGIEREPGRVRVPRISSVSRGYRADTGGPRFDFDLVAYGFRGGEFAEENLVLWAVDVAAGRLSETAVEHFENRCRLLSIDKGVPSDRLAKWIVFDGAADPGALEAAGRHGIYLTHATQMRILLNLFGLEESPPDAGPPGRAEGAAAPPPPEGVEFELVLPMKADTEVVAARVAEEVASWGSLDPDTTDRLKMALIEACINAFEHGGPSSGKVHLRYVLSPGRVDLYVRDEGKGFRDRGGSGKNRGWGLKLIRELVDDVEIVTGDDGTTVHMTKRVGAAEGGTGAEGAGG